MSELTLCNYCNLRRMRREHTGIRLQREDGGVSVYAEGERGQRHEEQRLAWFMELTDYCCC